MRKKLQEAKSYRTNRHVLQGKIICSITNIDIADAFAAKDQSIRKARSGIVKRDWKYTANVSYTEM
jgi:hypothetical protein